MSSYASSSALMKCRECK